MVKLPPTWSRLFTFRDRELFYNRIPFNNRAERAVEVPLAFDLLARQPSKESILEVGNVLQYYENALSDALGIRCRRIIDKFEVGHGIDNVDILDVDPEEKYQTIISVSTVEHVGQNSSPTGRFGEQKRRANLEAPLTAIAKIYDLLAPGGHALLTVPFGKLIDGGWYIQFSSAYLDLLTTKYNIPQEALAVGYLKRAALESRWSNPHQRWVEVDARELHNVSYDNIASGARAIAVIELTKLAQPSTFNPNSAILPASPLLYQRSPLPRSLFVGVGLVRSRFHR